ncbi:MAG TPA: dihydrolipoamide acetyltransferase family protein [Galbitalea sp.]|nr:dihydrolipoamide acetyltransferase family protein [Galbitalea sp.]
MSNQFLLPDLGEGLTEAEIVNWLVAPGDIIVVDQPVVEVESAKSIVELPSPYAGRVETLHAAQGEVVHKGAALITVGEASGESTPVAPAEGDLVPGTALRAADAEGGSGAVLVGYGTKESTMRLARPVGGRFGKRATADLATGQPTLDPTRRSPVISPLVRRQARENGIDASALLGSGPGSLVLRGDVDAAIAAKRVAAPAASMARSGVAAAPSGVAPAPGDQRIPMPAMRKLISSRLSHSRATIPEATIWLDVDATELVNAKARLEKSTGERFSLTALIARFTVAGLAQYPILNSSVDEAAGEIVQHGSIGLGLAAQTPRGLMVPVVHGAEAMSTTQLRDAIAEVVDQSRKGEFPQSALTGGTFTLNNYGGFGVDGSAPIINSPEVAMLGLGRILDRPWVVDGELAVRKVMTLSFVFDHRVCDGDIPSAFLTYIASCIQEPLLLLGSV